MEAIVGTNFSCRWTPNHVPAHLQTFSLLCLARRAISIHIRQYRANSPRSFSWKIRWTYRKCAIAALVTAYPCRAKPGVVALVEVTFRGIHVLNK